MDYPGPDSADIRDVTALNLAWLRGLRSAPAWPDCWGSDLRERARSLDEEGAKRLAAAPVLLYSLREHDSGLWSRLLRDERTADLFAARDAVALRQFRLVVATLTLLWRLGRQDLHTARLVSGAPAQWLETLAAQSLVDLVDRVARYPDLVEPRLADQRLLWCRLIENGSGSDDRRRRAAHLAVLQAVLTRQGRRETPRLAAAACRVAPFASKTDTKRR